MAQRFGLNKRRAAREAIAAAEATALAARADANHYRAIGRQEAAARSLAECRLGEVAQQLRCALGNESALVPLSHQKPRDITVNPTGMEYRWPIRQPVEPVSMGAKIPIAPMKAKIDYVALLDLHVQVQCDPYRFNRLNRFVSRTDGNEWHYVISREAVLQLKFSPSERAPFADWLMSKILAPQKVEE